MLRPLVRPIAVRLRLWVKASVDESLNASRLNDLDETLRVVRSELASISLNLASVKSGNESASTTLSLLARLFDRFQLGIDALRITQQSKTHTHTAKLADLKNELDLLKPAGDFAEEQREISLAQSQLLATLAAARRLEEIATAQSEQLRVAMAAEASLKQISASQSEHQNLTALNLARTDISLQRVAIPIGAELLMRTPDGFLLVPSEDNALVSSMWENCGRLEPGMLNVLTALLSDSDHVIDIGANIGLLTIPAARSVGESGSVLAIEPSSRVASLLRRSVALNGLSNIVKLQQCAVGEAAGKATLNLALPVGHSSLLPLPGSHGSEDVEVVRLDDLVPPKSVIKLVKIDAEGFEPQIWRGMQRIVAENPSIIVIVEYGPEHLRRANITVDSWLDGFLAHGLSAYEIDDFDGSLTPLRERDELHKVESLNLLLVRKDKASYPALVFKNLRSEL